MRKNYTSDFRSKVVLELLREELTIGQLASKYEIHRTQLNRWKKAVLEGIPELLSDGRKRDKLVKEHEEVVRDLYAQIGELSTKLSWLKKKSGIDI
jgi:putative transposase